MLSCSALILLVPLATTPPPQTGGLFGAALSSADVNGDGFSDVLIGEPLFDGEREDEGRVLVYLGSATGPVSPPAWVQTGGQAGARYGAALAGIGDLNGDGFEDVVIGAPDHDHLRGPGYARHVGGAPFVRLVDNGRIYVYLGSASGLASSPAMVQGGYEDQEHFGAALSAAGDVNADGYDNWVVGALTTGADVGAAFVFHGAASGPPKFPATMLLGTQSGGGFGSAVAGGCDVDGDGYDNVIVGAPDGGVAYPGSPEAGRVSLYFGSAQGILAAGAQHVQETGYDNGDFGFSVSGAGDVNGDGFDDFLVGDPTVTTGGHGVLYPQGGAAYLFLGSSAGATLWDIEWGFGSLRNMGSSVAGVGDVDGDGQPDMARGIPGYSGRGQFEVFSMAEVLGSRTSNQPAARLGQVLGSAGDVDGDGFADVLVSEPYYDVDGVVDAGRVQLNFGWSFGIQGPHWVATAP